MAEDLGGNWEADESIPIAFSNDSDDDDAVQLPASAEGAPVSPDKQQTKKAKKAKAQAKTIENEKRTAEELDPDAKAAKKERNRRKRRKFNTLKAKRKNGGGAVTSLEAISTLRLQSLTEQAQGLWSLWLSKKGSVPASHLESDPLAPEHLALLKDHANPDQHTLSRLPKHLHRLCPDVLASPPTDGHASILVISYSAKRANNFAKTLRNLRPGYVLKLFAKHLKIADQVKAIANAPKDRAVVAVGTPNRLLQLASKGALLLSNCRLCVLDLAPDAKKRNLLSLPDVSTDTFRLLGELRLQLSDTPLQLCLY